MNIDFFKIEKITKKDTTYLEPDFNYNKPKDLMVRGKSFYAVWDDDRKIWSTDEFDVQRIVDAEMDAFAARNPDIKFKPLYMRNYK